jgi:hypothetical protein
MMRYATVSELAGFLGRDLDPSEEVKADVVLDVVSGAIDGYVGARTVADDTKRNVALLAGRRLFELPAGVRQEILGDWQASYEAAQLLSHDERQLLDWGGTGGTKRARTLSVRTPSDLWEMTG